MVKILGQTLDLSMPESNEYHIIIKLLSTVCELSVKILCKNIGLEGLNLKFGYKYRFTDSSNLFRGVSKEEGLEALVKCQGESPYVFSPIRLVVD